MAWEDITERLEGKGWLGVGIGAVILAPVLIPALGRGLRPVAKGAIKGYLTVAEKARELFAETGEQLQDLVAEAKSEHEARPNGSEMMTIEEASAEEGARAQAGDEAGETEEGKSRGRSRKRDEPSAEAA
jgi:uncharacterized protein DUF5132